VSRQFFVEEIIEPENEKLELFLARIGCV